MAFALSGNKHERAGAFRPTLPYMRLFRLFIRLIARVISGCRP
jgi:hypothetical protein